MNDILILAQAPGSEGSSGISSEPVNSEQIQTTTPATEPNAAGIRTGAQRGFGNWLWIYIAILVVFMYLMLFRGPKKKQKEQKQMVNSLQKNDKVRTIGGIIGTIVDVKDDGITLKVDESNNTKIKITPGAISENISKNKK